MPRIGAFALAVTMPGPKLEERRGGGLRDTFFPDLAYTKIDAYEPGVKHGFVPFLFRSLFVPFPRVLRDFSVTVPVSVFFFEKC